MEVRDVFPNAVYAIGHSPERTEQLHISDTNIWTIVLSGAKVVVGQEGGARLSRISSLDVSDVICSKQRFHSQENLTPHVKPKIASCPRWLVLSGHHAYAISEMKFRPTVHTSVCVRI